MTSFLLQNSESEKWPLRNRQECLGHVDACVDNCGRYLTTDGSLVKYGGFIEGFQTTFATFYGEHDRYEDAEKLFLKSLSLQEQTLGQQNIATLSTLNNLGALYLGARQLGKAKEYLGLALQIKESLLGPDHPRTLNSVNNVGNLLVLQLKYDGAIQMYRRTYQGYSKINGTMHKTVVEAMNNLGEVALKKGELPKAELIFKEAFNKARMISGGKDDALVLYLASNVALVYKLQHRYQESIQTYMDVVLGREKLLGEKHSSTMQSMCEVADVYKLLGQEHSADEWYQRGEASPERKQRGEPLVKEVSKPISETATESSPGTSVPPNLNESNSRVNSIATQGDQMEWESDPAPSIDRMGQRMGQGACLPLPSNQSYGSGDIERMGHSFSQLPTAYPTGPSHNQYTSGIDRQGYPSINVPSFHWLQYDQGIAKNIEIGITRSALQAGSSIDRAGMQMMQQASSPVRAPLSSHPAASPGSTFGNDIDRAGMASWNNPPMIRSRPPIATPMNSTTYTHQTIDRVPIRMTNPNYAGLHNNLPWNSSIGRQFNPDTRPQNNCEHIERGGVCMHNVFHGRR